MTDLAYARGEEGDQALSNAARYSRVTPWVISLDSNAEIAFLAATFGAVETPGSKVSTAGWTDRTWKWSSVTRAVLMLFDFGLSGPPAGASAGLRAGRRGRVHPGPAGRRPSRGQADCSRLR